MKKANPTNQGATLNAECLTENGLQQFSLTAGS